MNSPTEVPVVMTLLASARPDGVPRDLWRAYGDRYPGGARREREADEAAARLRAQAQRNRAAAARTVEVERNPRTVVEIDLSEVDPQ